MRTSVGPSAGAVVAGTIIHIPGSTWMPTAWPGVVTSLIACRYGTPFKKASAWVAKPRLGTEPRALRKCQGFGGQVQLEQVIAGRKGNRQLASSSQIPNCQAEDRVETAAIPASDKMGKWPQGRIGWKNSARGAVIGEWSTAPNSNSSGREIVAEILMGLLIFLVAFLRDECQ